MFMGMTAVEIAPPNGKLGILTPGMGAVATTFIAGVIAARQGLAAPIGSVTQMAHIRLGTREDGLNPLIKDFVPLASLDDIVFGGWDPITSNALEGARAAEGAARAVVGWGDARRRAAPVGDARGGRLDEPLTLRLIIAVSLSSSPPASAPPALDLGATSPARAA